MSHIFPLRARLVFPVRGAPIDGGVITIADERIVVVGENVSGQPPIDLGQVAIVPGLVNTHTHLEFSHLAAPLGEPNMAFPDWIRKVVQSRRTAEAPPASRFEMGLRECLAAGTTTLGEIATSNWYETVTENPGLDATIFLEFIGRTSEQIEACLAKARHFLDTPLGVDGWKRGLSPHAPYSVHPELFEQLVALAVDAHAPVAFHLAESPEELEFLRTGTGPFDVLLRELGVYHDRSPIPPGRRPIDYLRVLARASRSLVIHGNYLDTEEQAFVAEHRDRMTVVYCPRTHDYFGHQRHPIADLLAAGVRIALGTDSRASNPDLSLWKEMRYVADRYPEIAPRTILELGTIRGAEALGCDHAIGTLEVGKLANLAVVSLQEPPSADPYEALFDSQSQVIRTMHRGRWCG